MKYSRLFPKTLKQVPSGAESLNHQLLVRAGFIHQEMAGVYTYLPLGWKVLDKISDIVREEMNAIGGQEIFMPVLHPGENWKKTGRFKSFDVLYKLKGAGDKDLVLGPTHEEIIYPLLAEYINSYKDLPLYLYQIQTKFRDEPRAKAGLLRGREFLMKDLYSFHTDDDDRDEYYKKVREAYFKIFKRIGIPVVKTKASGGTFSDLSEEFQTLTPSGEDTVFVCSKCGAAFNEEIIKGKNCLDCGGDLKKEKAIEVGNIFPLKRAYAEVFNLYFTDKAGEKRIVSAGCFGLGISRTMGAIVEVSHDEKGIIWPESVAPFKVHIVGLDLEDKTVMGEAEKIYKLLQVADPERSRRTEGVEVLFDDRVNVSAGVKFADADLIGIPYRVVVSKKTGDKLEVKKRSGKETMFKTLEQLVDIVCS
ncbi:hypothetical protein HYU45_04685 [Candidatus Daviesbacteria bacterium]|nr:hypothetical protein [Candidatus Daviesbacteria bacterium]